MKCALILSLVALASAENLLQKKKVDQEKVDQEKVATKQVGSLSWTAMSPQAVLEKERIASDKFSEVIEQQAKTHQSAGVAAMKSQLDSKLAYYTTEEGKAAHQKEVKKVEENHMKDAAEEMQWFADVARKGEMDKFGKLPAGLPDFPEDPKEREKFIQNLPVNPGTYSEMLALKKKPSSMLDLAEKDYKHELSALVEEAKKPSALLQQKQAEKAKLQQKAKEQHKSIEVLKASPKAFKQALRAWEKIVPEAASMLLQTEMAESPQEAKDVFMEAKALANRATALHQVVFDSVEEVTNKEQLMGVAQNRITSLLVRQSEASLSDFDALEGCVVDQNYGFAQDSNYEGSESRCLCVADNICNKAGQAHGGEFCSIVSSATCMAPKNEKEATEMSTV